MIGSRDCLKEEEEETAIMGANHIVSIVFDDQSKKRT